MINLWNFLLAICLADFKNFKTIKYAQCHLHKLTKSCEGEKRIKKNKNPWQIYSIRDAKCDPSDFMGLTLDAAFLICLFPELVFYLQSTSSSEIIMNHENYLHKKTCRDTHMLWKLVEVNPGIAFNHVNDFSNWQAESVRFSFQQSIIFSMSPLLFLVFFRDCHFVWDLSLKPYKQSQVVYM